MTNPIFLKDMQVQMEALYPCQVFELRSFLAAQTLMATVVLLLFWSLCHCQPGSRCSFYLIQSFLPSHHSILLSYFSLTPLPLLPPSGFEGHQISQTHAGGWETPLETEGDPFNNCVQRSLWLNSHTPPPPRPVLTCSSFLHTLQLYTAPPKWVTIELSLSAAAVIFFLASLR